MTVNLVKAVGLVVALILISGLLALGRIDETAGVGLLAWTIGYLTGNGSAMLRRVPSTPVVWREKEKADD